MFGTGQKEEAMLYYLYMMSDGEISGNERKLFSKICKEMDLDEDDKRVVMKKCKEMTKNSSTILGVILSNNLDEQVGRGWLGITNSSMLSSVIWNLVNLGYADKVYSDDEKRIVDHLVKKWEIDPEVYQEMVDTADTMLALTNQKEWVASTFEKGSARNKRMKKIDSEIERLHSDIKLTIDELTM